MKQFLKAVARNFGFDIHRVNTNTTNSKDPYVVMRSLVNDPKPIIFDIGANLGLTAQRFRLLFPEAKLFCFEPFPPSFKRLSSVFENDPLVESYQLALSDTTGASKLTVNQSTATNSLLSSDKRAQKYWGSSLLDTHDVIEVKTETVDRFCNHNRIDHLNILKLDVQGAEYAVLEGTYKLLQNQKIDIVYMEMITAPTYIGQRKLSEYLTLFDALKYELFDFYIRYLFQG